MSGYRLCQVKRAEVPYYIENISTNIYSLEELCYYFQHNIYLLDESIINEELCDWIRDELGLKQLYQRLYHELENEVGLAGFILPVFKEIGYLTQEEFRNLNNQLIKLEHEPEVARKKLKADYLAENGKYINALRVYKDTIEQAQTDHLGGQFFGEVYHNMGCIHMYMLQYDEALNCFLTANENMRTDESLRAYMTACYLAKPRDKFLQEAMRFLVSDKMQAEIQESVELARGSMTRDEVPENEDEFLNQLTLEYHSSTGL